jgi:hypothetical protein
MRRRNLRAARRAVHFRHRLRRIAGVKRNGRSVRVLPKPFEPYQLNAAIEAARA